MNLRSFWEKGLGMFKKEYDFEHGLCEKCGQPTTSTRYRYCRNCYSELMRDMDNILDDDKNKG